MSRITSAWLSSALLCLYPWLNYSSQNVERNATQLQHMFRERCKQLKAMIGKA